jgi:hypothetical protein
MDMPGWRGNLSARKRFAWNRATATDAAFGAAILRACTPQRECARFGFAGAIKCDRNAQPGANLAAPRRDFTRHTV